MSIASWWRDRQLRALEKKYVRAGAEFGDAISYSFMGKCVGFDQMLDKWASLERRYSEAGFRTISLDDFVGYGGYGVQLKGLGSPRSVGEKPVLHAEIYRAVFYGREPAGCMDRVMAGEVVIGTHVLPSTEAFVEAKEHKDGGEPDGHCHAKDGRGGCC